MRAGVLRIGEGPEVESVAARMHCGAQLSDDGRGKGFMPC